MKLYGLIISWISTISSILLIVLDIPQGFKNNIIFVLIYVFILIFIYIVVWGCANKKNSAKLIINDTTIFIKEGDIFNQDGLKIIPFNEYFDTIVDDKLISSNSLNGKYILKYNINVEKLDEDIREDIRLKNSCKVVDKKRFYGNKIKYPLGSIYKNGSFLLLAFSKFDTDNRAYLDKSSFLECLLKMWNEIDVYYSSQNVFIPLLGAGITRFQGGKLTEQDLLELILISFRLSNIRFKSNITIIIHKSNIDDINFFKLSNYLD